MWILIPAYEPGPALVTTVRAVIGAAPVVVVDDGSGVSYAPIFDAVASLGAVVIPHEVNRGKAAALRTGFAWLLDVDPGATVVCADADGQHLPSDILRVGREVARREEAGMEAAIVLGSRSFSRGTPLRSRIGNAWSSLAVLTVLGSCIGDTQTGLRAIPGSLVPWVAAVPGRRFTYEMRVLLSAIRSHVPLVEVPISTVYEPGNPSSHFRPVRDSMLVMAPLAGFAASSFAAWCIDTAALMALYRATGSLGMSLVLARALSGAANFAVNRHAVFKASGPWKRQLRNYAAVACAVLGIGYVAIQLLTMMGVPLLAAKTTVDVTLWLTSFCIQRAVVFRRPQGRHRALDRVYADSSRLERRSHT